MFLHIFGIPKQHYMKLENAKVLITGGSIGIGRATAKILSEAGAKVAITGRNKEILEKTAKELNVLAIHADVSKQEDVDRTYSAFLAAYGSLDILVNNAGSGAGSWARIHELDIAKMQEIYAINVFGAAMMGKEAAKLFIAQNHGNIINIASTAGTRGFENGTIYSSSKFALRGMTECWRAELRKNNVRVFLVNPSEVKTAFGTGTHDEKPEEDNKLRAHEIGYAIKAVLEMDDRGFIPELQVWATNPF